MDKELQILLDEARKKGASTSQLEDILARYNAKKKEKPEEPFRFGVLDTESVSPSQETKAVRTVKQDVPEIEQPKNSFLEWLADRPVAPSVGGDIADTRTLMEKKPSLVDVLKENPEYGNKMVNRSVAAAQIGIIMSEAEAGLRSIDFEEVADLQKIIDYNQPKEGDFFYNDNEGFVGFMYDLARTLPESFISMGAAAETPITVGSVAVGAGTGSVVPGLGTATGAGAGFAFATSAINEYGTTIMSLLDEAGVDIRDKDAIEAAFADEDVINEIKLRAGKRAGIIGLLDAISGGVSGKIAKKTFGKAGSEVIEEIAGKGADDVVKEATKLTRRATGVEALETAIESSFGGAGEALGSLAAGQEVSMRDVLLETFADPTSKVISTGSRKAQSLITGIEQDPVYSQFSPEQRQMLKFAKQDPERFSAVINAVGYANNGEIKQINAKIAALKESSPAGKDKAIDKLIGDLQKRKAELQLNAFKELAGATTAEVAELGDMITDINDLNAKYASGELTGEAQSAVKAAIEEKLAAFNEKYGSLTKAGAEAAQTATAKGEGDTAPEFDYTTFSEEDQAKIAGLQDELRKAADEKDTKKQADVSQQIIDIENKYRDTEKEAGVPSGEQAGQAPIQEQPVQEGGTEEVAPSGVVQKARQEEVVAAIEFRAKPEYVAEKVSALPVEDTKKLGEELQGEFGLLTGENPMAEPMTEAENAELNKKAEAWLRDKGYSPRPVSGKYGQAENSFFVPGLTKEDAIAFAKEFNQESVAHSEGLVYQDGSMNPRVKEDDNFSFEEFNNESDFVSVVNTAEGPKTFQVGYDFETKTEPVAPSPKKKARATTDTDAIQEIDAVLLEKNGATKKGEPRGKVTAEFKEDGILFKTTEDTGPMKDKGGEMFVPYDRIDEMPNVNDNKKSRKNLAEFVMAMEGIADKAPTKTREERLRDAEIKVENLAEEAKVSKEDASKIEKLVNNFNKNLNALGLQPYTIKFFNSTYAAEYADSVTNRGKTRFKALHIGGLREIVINTDKATPGTVAHEMLHAYLAQIKLDPKKVVQFANIIEKELLNGTKEEIALALELKMFRDSYVEDKIYGSKTKDDPKIAEEFLAEYIGKMVSRFDEAAPKNTVSLAQKLRNAIVKFFAKVGIVDKNLVAKINDKQEAVDFVHEVLNVIQGRVKGQNVQKGTAKKGDGVEFSIDTSRGSEDKVFGTIKGTEKVVKAANQATVRTKDGTEIDNMTANDILGDKFTPSGQATSFLATMARGMFSYNKKGEKVTIPIAFKSDKLFKDIENALRRYKNPTTTKQYTSKAKYKNHIKTDVLRPAVEKLAIEFKEFMKANIRQLYNSLTPEFVEASKHWYDGANRIAQRLSKEYNISVDQAAGILAVLSPQNDWFNNIENARQFLEVVTNYKDVKFDKDIFDAAAKYSNAKSSKKGESSFTERLTEYFDKFDGKSIADIEAMEKAEGLDLSLVKANIVRAISMAKLPQKVNEFGPDGNVAGVYASPHIWMTDNVIANAFGIYNDPENTSAYLGNGNKVRNFYNNIADPNSKDGYLTADTHALAVALNVPTSAADAGGFGLFGGEKSFKYAIVKDAYVEVAEELGILPRELQSVTWEAVRTGLNEKARKKKDQTHKLIKKLQNSTLTYNERAKEIIRLNPSETPGWAKKRGITTQKTATELRQVSWSSTEQGAGTAGTGTRGLGDVRGRDSKLDRDADINFSIDNTDVARQQIESGKSAQFDYNIVADLEDVFNDAGVEGTDIFEMMFEKSFKKKDAVNFEKVFDATFGTEIDYTQLFEDATTTEEAYEAAGTTTKEVNEFKKKFKGAARPKNVELIELVANYVNKRKELKGNDKAIAKLRENFVNEVRAKHRPLAPAKRSSIKPPASFKDIVSALNKGKVKIGIIGLTKSLPEGTKVGLRLDIPSMSYKGTAVVSIHDGRADLRKPNQDNNSSAKVLGYGQVARIKNVKFTTNVATAEKVGMGEAKTPFARMAGNWMNISTEDAIRLAEEAIKSDEWVEVTMNPASYSYFYDSVTGDKIVSAEEVIQVGAQVFAKNPETQNAMEVRYSIELNDADIPKQAHKKNIFQRLASGFVYTEMQKQARILFEAKESQVTMSVRAGRKIARSIGKVANTFELIQMAADYMEGRNRTKITQELDRTDRGRKLLELLVQADAMVEGYANEIVEDPAFANLSMELKMAISMNAGSYLKTRYKFYTDKSYKITDKARRAAIKSEFDLITARTIATAKKAGLTEDQINTLLEDEYENIKQKAVDSIDSYINNIEEGRAMASQKGADIKIPSSSFQFKKDLPQHIQELLGKEKNPLTRFTATIEAQANILYKGQMVAGLLTAAKSDLGDFILDDEPPVSKAKLFKKVNDPYSLLNGKYVHNEILEVFDRAPLYESDKAWLQGYFSLLKQARKSKVIWNIPTWRKNLTGGWYFMMANGVLFNKNVASDIKNRLALTIGSDKFTADEFTEQLMEIMGKNGLIGTNINSQLVGINDAAYQFMLDGDEGALRSRTAKILNSISNADKWLQEKYSAVDDYTKLVIFRQEIESFAGKLYGKKYSELNAAQKDVVHADAAEFVKQNTPTFSRLPKFYDKVAVIPIFGDFASFQLESFRSFSANLRNAVKDMKTALNGVDENGNKLSPAQKKAYMASAQKKLAGVALVTALRTATVIGAQEIFLDDDDEEIADDAKMVTPEWMKGQTLIVKSIDKDGNVRVYNYSSEDPYGTIGDITNGKDALESVFETFVRPNIAADYLFRMSKGEDVYGRKIFDKSDSNMQALGKFLGYTSKTFVTPPFISSSYRDVLKQNELTAKEFLTSPAAVGDLAKTITERSIIRDYKYNIIDQYRYSLMDLGKSKPISEAGSPERRMALLDEVREQLNAIERIAASKDNPTLRKDAIDYTKRYLKKEDWMYVFTGEKPE